MTKKTGTHEAEQTFSMIQHTLKPEYDLRLSKITCYGGLDCRVWPKGEYWLPNKIGSLFINPDGTVKYAPLKIREFIAK